MTTTETLVRGEVWHQDYNLEKKDNRQELPSEKAVFGFFGIVNEQPVNCRYVAETENLRQSVSDLFGNPPGKGLKKFMQGPWIKMLQYELLPGSSREERQNAVEEWTRTHAPKIDEEGEYPGYYD